MYSKQASGQQGFTLVELLIVIAIIAILLSLAAPSFNEFFEKNRLKRAAEEVYGLVTKARAETVIRDADMTVAVDTATWCLGYAATPGCDCTLAVGEAASCSVSVAGTPVLQVVDASSFSGIDIDNGSNDSTFMSVQGTADGGNIHLKTDGGWELKVIVSGMGRVRICAPVDSTSTMGYAEC